jgi:hypothetical protein
MHDLIVKIVRFLDIKKPYRIIIKPKFQPNKNRAQCWARYKSGNLVRHDIEINLHKIETDLRSIDVLIAHEFIHAWQVENGVLDSDNCHDKKFQKMAKKLGKFLNFDNVFVESIDV